MGHIKLAKASGEFDVVSADGVGSVGKLGASAKLW